ncbi:Anaphase-promoting complex subunit 1 [Smittium culicis]|uniref:Anaphase-promoting complex subunit 1 n=1 Tax=Smittium culicis TaxID=133412 RepID=A0A1R1YN03_9FUNG|nr:Anaphase-promoting complex subunit 1 [Smittium culicis]
MSLDLSSELGRLIDLIENMLEKEHFTLGIAIPLLFLKLTFSRKVSIAQLNSIPNQKTSEIIKKDDFNPNNWSYWVNCKHIPNTPFKNDLRLLEAESRIQSHLPAKQNSFEPTLIKFGIKINPNMEKAFEVCAYLSTLQQSLATPLGRAGYTFDTRQLNPNERLSVPDLVLGVKEKSEKALKVPDASFIGTDAITLYSFSNGVSTALSVSKDSMKNFDPSWVLFNAPLGLDSIAPELKFGDPEFNAANQAHNNAMATYSGIIFGLGLVGNDFSPLKNLSAWRMIPSFNLRIDLLTISFLLGRACCFIGKGRDNFNTADLLKLHIPKLSFLSNQNSYQFDESLFASSTVQSAAILGLGIVYRGVPDTLFVNFLVSQLRFRDYLSSTDEFSSSKKYLTNTKEYILACGISLGLTCLGKGDFFTLRENETEASLFDALSYNKQKKEKMRRKKTGDRKSEFLDMLLEPAVVLSLGLAYINTKNESVALYLTREFLSEFSLENSDPSLILLKSMAKWLIFIENINPSLEFMYDNCVPSNFKSYINNFSRNSGNLAEISAFQIFRDNLDSLILKRSLIMMMTGYLFALSMKYSGTYNVNAKITVISIFDAFLHDLTQLSSYKNHSRLSYEERVTKSTLAYSCVILTLCLSVIMAGSGDLDVLIRLRILDKRLMGYLQSEPLLSAFEDMPEIGDSEIELICKNILVNVFGYSALVKIGFGILFMSGCANKNMKLDNSIESISVLVVSLLPIIMNCYENKDNSNDKNIYQIQDFEGQNLVMYMNRFMWTLAIKEKDCNDFSKDKIISSKQESTSYYENNFDSSEIAEFDFDTDGKNKKLIDKYTDWISSIKEAIKIKRGQFNNKNKTMLLIDDFDFDLKLAVSYSNKILDFVDEELAEASKNRNDSLECSKGTSPAGKKDTQIEPLFKNLSKANREKIVELCYETMGAWVEYIN